MRKQYYALICVAFVFLLLISCAEEKIEVTKEEIGNRPPSVSAIKLSKETVLTNEASSLAVSAKDLEGDSLTFQWEVSAGELTEPDLTKYYGAEYPGDRSFIHWKAPSVEQVVVAKVEVSDGINPPVVRSRNIKVLKPTTKYNCDYFTVKTGHTGSHGKFLLHLPFGQIVKQTKKGQAYYRISVLQTEFEIRRKQCRCIKDIYFSVRGKKTEVWKPERCFTQRPIVIPAYGGVIYEGYEKTIPAVFLNIRGSTNQDALGKPAGKTVFCQIELTVDWRVFQ